MNDNKISIKFRFSKINVLKYTQYELENVASLEGKPVEFGNNFDLKISPKTNEISVLSTISLIPKESKEIFSELKVECVFEVLSLDEFLQNNGLEIKIPDELLAHFTSLSIGSVRGVLSEKLKGTPFQNVVLPLINTKDLIKKDKKEIPNS